MRFFIVRKADYAAEKLALVAQTLGVNIAGLDTPTADEKRWDSMKLREVGVPEEGLGICPFPAIADPASLFNTCHVDDPGELLQL